MEAAVHAVEVAAAPLEALVLRKRLPDSVLMPAGAIRAEREDPVATFASGQRHRYIEVAIETVTLIEAADLQNDVATCGGAVPLDRFDLTARHLVEVFEVGRT